MPSGRETQGRFEPSRESERPYPRRSYTQRAGAVGARGYGTNGFQMEDTFKCKRAGLRITLELPASSKPML